MPGSDPATNGDLSADIRRLEHALAACALQVETIKDCQDKLDAQTQELTGMTPNVGIIDECTGPHFVTFKE